MIVILDEPLIPCIEILRRAFPGGVSSGERRVLMASIYDEFSDRNLASLLSTFLDMNSHVALREAISAWQDLGGSKEVSDMRNYLAKMGWEFDCD